MSSHTQRAVVFAAQGKIEYQTNFPAPDASSLSPTQVLVEVHAAALNPVDWKAVDYNFLNWQLPRVLGLDCSGVILAVGKDVKDYKVGQPVVAYANLAAMGAFGEKVIVEETMIAIKPHNVSFLQAASLPVILTSNLGVEAAKTGAGKTFFVPGGAGGVGHFTVQLAKLKGATVLSSGGRHESLELLKKLGVDHIVDYKSDVSKQVLFATGGKGADAVFDATYQESSFMSSAQSLRQGGLFVYLGEVPPSEATLKLLKEKNCEVVEVGLMKYMGASQQVFKEICSGTLTKALQLISNGQLKPHIGKVISLEDVPAELAAMRKGTPVNGKIVVRTRLPTSYAMVQKAVVCTEVGKPMKLLTDWPMPSIGDDDVLVEVAAASLNPIDWKIQHHNYFQSTIPFASGHDFAGRVIAHGKNAQKELPIGSHVVGWLNLLTPGAFAEYVSVNKNFVALIPSPKVTFADAATLPVAFLSAWEGLHVQAPVQSGHTVFISGGAGGVGHFAVQVAKAKGAKVISTASRPETIAVLEQLKVDNIIDYKKDVPAIVQSLTNGGGADISYDSTYVDSSFLVSAKSTKKGGTLVILGNLPDANSETMKYAKEHNITVKSCDLVPFCFAPLEVVKEHISVGLQHGIQLIIQGKLHPVIGKKITLEEVDQELELNRKGQARPSKVVAVVRQH